MYSSLLAATEGVFDSVPVDKILLAEDSLYRELKAKHPKMVDSINTGNEPPEDDRKTILRVATAIADSYKDKTAAKEDN